MPCFFISRREQAGDKVRIEFENLKKSYSGSPVIDIDKGEIRHGETTAIIGPNGTGKTTLLNILAGILPPDEGVISYDGSTDFPQREVSLVFQEPYMISTTVEKNISYPLKIRGAGKEEIEARIDELTKALSLEKLRKQRALSLSGGEKQKTALARALSFHPNLLMLDEPTANIDPYSTMEIERMLASIREKENITIIFVTHNIAQVKRISDRFIFMVGGHIEDSGPSSLLLSGGTGRKLRSFLDGELII